MANTKRKEHFTLKYGSPFVNRRVSELFKNKLWTVTEIAPLKQISKFEGQH